MIPIQERKQGAAVCRLKQPRLPKALPQLAADSHAYNQLYGIKAKIWDDSQEQCIHKAHGLLACQPYCAEEITDGSAQKHAQQMEEAVTALVHEQAAD